MNEYPERMAIIMYIQAIAHSVKGRCSMHGKSAEQLNKLLRKIGSIVFEYIPDNTIKIIKSLPNFKRLNLSPFAYIKSFNKTLFLEPVNLNAVVLC